MKRTLVLVVTAGAAVLAFAVAANFFPDWTWEVLNTARNTKARILGETSPAINLSTYALPPNSVEAEQVSCPSLPGNALYTIGVRTPPGEKCSLHIGDLSLNNYGPVGKPLRGWVGCIDGQDLKGVRINALSSDDKGRVASTITNSKGKFIFPTLKAGTYHLSVNTLGLERVDANVTINPQSQATLCLTTAGTTGGR